MTCCGSELKLEDGRKLARRSAPRGRRLNGEAKTRSQIGEHVKYFDEVQFYEEQQIRAAGIIHRDHQNTRQRPEG